VDLSLHKRAMTERKRLKQVVLFELPRGQPELLMDVNISQEIRDSFAPALFTAT
jgi:hypothetical protein